MTEPAVIGHHDQNIIDSEKLVTMKIDNQLFGIPILQVQDIVEPRMITPVPLAPSAIAGVMNLRGRIVTVISLRRCLGLEDRIDRERRMSITVEFNGDLYTLLVDEIGDVRDLPSRDFESPPTTLGEELRPLCTGIFRLKDDLLVVLDVERILDADMLMKSPPVTLKQRASKSEAPWSRKQAKPAPGPSVHILPETGNSLFERLGGDDAVEAAVEIFYSRVVADELLKPFFADVSMDQQSFKLRKFLTGAFGGPQACFGRSRQQARENPVTDEGLGEKHFAAITGHLKATLDELGIEDNMIDEVMAIVTSTRVDVLNL